jgi:hypothetical protein
VSRNIVCWSGGADSTLALHGLALNSSVQNPVVAMTLDRHPQLDDPWMDAQRVARSRYRDFATRKGLHIEEQTYDIVAPSSSSFVATGSSELGQPTIWLCAIMPYIQDGDMVHFGYIKNDVFWHHRHNYEEAFYAICALKHIQASLVYPLEYTPKFLVLMELAKHGIPDDAWMSCDSVVNGNQCGLCYKCMELALAKVQSEMEKKNPGSPYYEAS